MVLQIAQVAQMVRRKIRINSWSKRKRRHQIRPATLDDLKSLINVERRAWEGTRALAFGEKELRAQLLRYKDGTLLAERISTNGTSVEAFCSLMRVSRETFDLIRREQCTWEDITSSGYIEMHDPEGVYLYGVNLSVPARAEKMGIGSTLRAQIASKIVREGLKGIVFEGRLPGLAAYNSRKRTNGESALDGHSYAQLKDSRGKAWDPELRDYLATPLMVLLDVKQDFFQDPDSENWGVLLFWPNPIYKIGLGFLYRLRPISSPVINVVAKAMSYAV